MSLLVRDMRLELIANCFPNEDADEDNGDVFWGVVEENEEEDASESEFVSGETQIKRGKRFLGILILFNLFRAWIRTFSKTLP